MGAAGKDSGCNSVRERSCDAVMVGVRHGISAGMKAEIDFARRCGVPVQYIQE